MCAPSGMGSHHCTRPHLAAPNGVGFVLVNVGLCVCGLNDVGEKHSIAMQRDSRQNKSAYSSSVFGE